MPDPVDVDLKRLVKSSILITDFNPLPSTDLIGREIQTQTKEKSQGGLVETNLVIFGGGTAVSLITQQMLPAPTKLTRTKRGRQS